MMVLTKTLAVFSALPAIVNGGIRGLKSSPDHVPRRLEDVGTTTAETSISFCNPVPLSEGADGLPRYIEDKVVLVLLTGVNITAFDTFALGVSMAPAYNRAVNCTYSFGSIRELTDCEIIPDAIVLDDTDGYLIRCNEFFSNSVDNNVFISDVDTYAAPTCECECDDGLIFPLLTKDGVCDCPCGITPNCECYAPFFDTFLSYWNTMMMNAAGIENVTIVDVIELTILDPNECGFGEETTINGTTVCPGNSTESFKSKCDDGSRLVLLVESSNHAVRSTMFFRSSPGFFDDSSTAEDNADDDVFDDGDRDYDPAVVTTESSFPSASPTEVPTDPPTDLPTVAPSVGPTASTAAPSASTAAPTTAPSASTATPTTAPSASTATATPTGTTPAPTLSPSLSPIGSPIAPPTDSPTTTPITDPTDAPTKGRVAPPP
jgi:hypothetical protein